MLGPRLPATRRVAACKAPWAAPRVCCDLPPCPAPNSSGRQEHIFASRWERDRGILCKGQFIILWTPTGHPDWTLNKLCQDICSKLASLAALHKQKPAGVQHVEQLLNRVINLYKQKNLPNKHISSHHTPGYKAELSCKLIRISCLLQPRRKAQATYRGEQRKSRGMCTLGKEQWTGQIYLAIVTTTWCYFFCDREQRLERWSKPKMTWL